MFLKSKAAIEAPVAPVSNAAAVDQPADATTQAAETAVKPEQPQQAEAPKGEIKYIKPAMNLEQTLKAVTNLHRLTIHRVELMSRIKILEDFEDALSEEFDILDEKPYLGCKLSIKDPKGREFFTNTPGLIRMVAQFLFTTCTEKLAEIEANIIFPNA